MPNSELGPGRRRMASRLLLLAAVLLAALVLWARSGRMASCGRVLESPETQVRKALAAQQSARFDGVYGSQAGATAELSTMRYAEVVSSFEGERATVVALLEATGRVGWRDESAELRYVGREKFHMHPCSQAVWCAEEDQFSRLRGVLLLLLRRQDAFNSRDPAVYSALISERYREQGLTKTELLDRLSRNLRAADSARQRILSWQVRVERQGAEVGEDYLIEAAGQTARKARARYTLVLEGDGWVFSSGL